MIVHPQGTRQSKWNIPERHSARACAQANEFACVLVLAKEGREWDKKTRGQKRLEERREQRPASAGAAVRHFCPPADCGAGRWLLLHCLSSSDRGSKGNVPSFNVHLCLMYCDRDRM